MTVALEQFVKQIEDSGVIALGKLKEFVPPNAHPKDAQELARQLVQSKKLTKFQVQEIFQGRAKSLILGNYTILDEIGAGGMGQIFKAEHRRMKRIVAIKMLPRNLTKDAHSVARFQREVEAAAKLRHPNIVAADDADEAGGVHFLVMEYVEGNDLSTLIKKHGPFSVAKAVNYILQVAHGLDFAHKKGVIHRDVKPGNLLLNTEGTVKILDMGLARFSSGGNAATQAELTGSAAVLGTVDYMAPEQAVSTKHADARADIYSLGCSLYYLLTGKSAYDGDTLVARLMAHREAPIPSMGDDVPEQLHAIFAKMVAKNVEDRYQTMSEVVVALQRFRSGQQPSPSIQKSVDTVSSGDVMTFLNNVELNTIHKPKPTKKSAPTASNKKNKTFLMVAIGAALLGLAILAGVIFKGLKKGSVAANADAENRSAALDDPTLQQRMKDVGAMPAIASVDAKKSKELQQSRAKQLGVPVEMTNSIGMKLVLIPPGDFMMGSPQDLIEEEVSAHGDDQWNKEHLLGEGPRHRVRITKPFYLGVYEVTQEEYQRVMGSNPSDYSATGRLKEQVAGRDTKRFPVENVSWDDAVEFCRKLSEMPAEKVARRTYRLPSEAQWEYACRAGSTGRYSFSPGGDATAKESDENGLSDYGWFNGNSGGTTHAVGGKRSNAWGLYDMQGNVWQWCQDWYDNEYYTKSPVDDPGGPLGALDHVIRGGGWDSRARNCRPARRGDDKSGTRNADLGFRISLFLADK